MKLFGSSRSPYVQKVIIAAHELELTAHIQFVPLVVNSTAPHAELVRINPLGEIPVLQTDDGQTLHDSLVICEYLNDLVPDHRLLPPSGAARWRALTHHAIGQGMIETLVKLFTERKRTADPRHATYAEAFTRKFRQTLPALDAVCEREPMRAFDLGDIAVTCALAYADFRFTHLNWRQGYPGLARHYGQWTARASVRAVEFAGEGTHD